MKKTLILIIILGILLVSLGFSIGMNYNTIKNETSEEKITLTEINDYQQCANKPLGETAYCLRDYVYGIYNYQPRDDTPKPLTDIIENGGDCYDYNKLYEQMGKELGFSSYSFRIESLHKAHRIAVIMDDTGYCRLDMLHDPDCFIFNSD